MTITKDLGAVSAYAYAVEKGYTGTEEEFAELMASYATVAEEAAESAESAQASATTANSAASTATNKASEATTAAQTATAKAEEAQADADAAALDASQALSAASTATSKASEAAQSASDAVTAKIAAQTAQTAAEGSATTAQTAAQTATTKAAEAAESARTLTIDPTLSQSGQAADAKVVGDEIGELKTKLTSLNLTTLSGIKATYGYPLGSKKWGNINSTYQHKVIPVQGGEKIIIEAKNLPSGYRLYYGALTSYSIPTTDADVNYSSNSEWSDRRTVDRAYTIVDTIPGDARYIFVEVVFGGVSTLPSKFEIGGYDYSKSTAVEAVTANNQDLVPIKWVQGTINATTGENTTMNNRLRSSNTFYDVSRGIKFTVPSGYKFEVFYYSANGGGYLTYHDFDTSEEVYVYPRVDAKYCRFVCAKTDNTPITTTEVYAEYISDGNLPKWYALGDSITQGYFSYINGSNVAAYKTFSNGYVSHIAYNGGLALINCGIGGSGYVRAGSVLTQYNARQNVDSIDFSDADLVTLAYGLNDWKYNQNIGTFDDDVETGGTIYSNMRYCIEKILGDNPQCKIIIIPPFNCSAYGTQATNWGLGHSFSNNGTLEQIYTALKTVAEYYGIEFIDTTHASVINRITAPSLLIDGIHPSAKCHATLGAELTKKINYA